ncbi:MULTISPECIES: hypothetical protein [unclassified Lonepinella]|uniref:hypothetical protein n=1 Tax=unclassified Lonepinella TaxID=2642006 RepID=UPI0036DDF81E
MNNVNVISGQIDTLEQRINQLFQSVCLIYVMRKSNLDTMEACEIENALQGIENLLQGSIDELNDCVDLFRKAVNGAEIANNPPATGKSEKVIQPHASPNKRLQGEQ